MRGEKGKVTQTFFKSQMEGGAQSNLRTESVLNKKNTE